MKNPWKRESRKRFDPADLEHLANRVRTLDNEGITTLFDSSVTNIQLYAAEFYRNRTPDLLREIKLAAEQIFAVSDEMLGRLEGAPRSNAVPARQMKTR